MAKKTCHQRPAYNPWDIGFGVVTLMSALLTLLIWIPYDIVGGFIITGLTGQPEPGDAFFPTILTGTLLVLSVIQLLSSTVNRTNQDKNSGNGKITLANIKFLILFYAIVLGGLAIMYWLGPLVVETLRMTGVIDSTYRQLIDTRPYKYLGYLVGGFLIPFGLISWAEKKVRWQAVFAIIIVLISSIFIFDILLNNVQLPPNADF